MRSVAKGATSEARYVLQTSPHLLRKWLTGDLQPPINKYITALQIVGARGVRDTRF